MASGDESTAKEQKEPTTEEEKSSTAVVSRVIPKAKHPLQNRWALWFFKNDKTKSWTANLRNLTSFDTVEDFWAVYNHIQFASKLQSGCDYSLFKDGIEPMWEDKKNKEGGRWLINTSKQQRQQDLDRIWLETLLCLIGEAFGDFSDNVNGAVVQIRNKGDKLAIWTGNAVDQDANLAVGRTFKERLAIHPKTILAYEAHQDTMSKTGSTSKHKYTL